MYPDLKPGDLFLTCSPSIFGSVVNMVQRWWSLDNHSKYTHAGIIVDAAGRTFESTIMGAVARHIAVHDNQALLIARHDCMNLRTFEMSYKRVQYHSSALYPVYRLFLHLIPPFAKYVSFNRAVCSEVVAQFLYNAEMMPFWRGVNPDDLHDIFKRWKHFHVVLERRHNEQ